MDGWDNGAMIRIGLISDTHNRLPRRAVEIFLDEMVTAIIHAGDICTADILYELEMIAPVTAVLGNNDYDLPGWRLEPVATVRLGGVNIGVVHSIRTLGALRDDWDVVICGHTHKPMATRDGRTGALVFNPGAASRARVPEGPSVGILEIDDRGEGFEPRMRLRWLRD